MPYTPERRNGQENVFSLKERQERHSIFDTQKPHALHRHVSDDQSPILDNTCLVLDRSVGKCRGDDAGSAGKIQLCRYETERRGRLIVRQPTKLSWENIIDHSADAVSLASAKVEFRHKAVQTSVRHSSRQQQTTRATLRSWAAACTAQHFSPGCRTLGRNI